MNEKLWAEAEKLANRLYAITYETDTLSNGEQILLLRHPELPAVKAQGRDLAEAKKNLDEARVDYIYTLLVDNLPVPAPQTSSNNVTHSFATGHNWKINAANDEDKVEAAFDKVITPQDRTFVAGLSFGGDLMKHG